MGQHEAYGKAVLRDVAGLSCDLSPPPQEIGGLAIRLDAVIGGRIAVEIESRTAKQIRGAVMDLLLHPAPKKLLLILPVHHRAEGHIGKHCRAILARFLRPGSFAVVELGGSGDRPTPGADAALVRSALQRLGLDGPAEDDRPQEQETARRSP